MIRFLAPALRRLFKPDPAMDMNADLSSDLDGIDIVAKLDAAVCEHERLGAAERETYTRRLDTTMNDLLAKMGKRDANG